MDTNLSLISEEELNEIVEDYITALDEIGLGGGAGVGLSLPGGYINGAPKADDVAKVSKKLKNKGMSGYEEIDEDINSDTIECSNCGWEWEKSEGGEHPYTCHKCGNDNSDEPMGDLTEMAEMAKSDLDAVEKYADQQLSPEDIELGKESDHFFQRLNDPRNGKQISPAELNNIRSLLLKIIELKSTLHLWQWQTN